MACGTTVLGWLAVSIALLPGFASAQMGQMGMAPGNGLVNRASNAFRELNMNGPGFLYYGINAADRGLGYRGSYMTLGGFIPVVEDDLGGIWSTDLRTHLSNYGGFFSNVGAVRKQLLGGGSLLGFGVYWDYDGDQNQYSDQTIGVIDPVIFPGGFSYNQVGVSGEFLTDWGNLRSNGYIPVGSTGQSTGQFASDRILCMQGINAALGGADLEVGAYIPSLADWAGMVSVGGYAYGNTRYQLDNGATLVPWFGGVYTRLDLTLANNWDFSLQYNNDSYFDSTGFARLTYRLGGSRRRNVPDQMEQPMMRNEHIVRAHQNAVEARNPDTQAPWRVLHVDNAATGSTGTGTVTNPFTTMAAAEAAADREYDIVYVQGSGIPYSNIPGAPLFSFQADNQYLIGEGSTQTIPTVECGNLRVSPTINPSLYPTLSPGPNATAIEIASGVFGQTINGFVINASSIGINAQSSMGTNTFSNVTINGGRDGINVSGGANYAMSNMLLNGQSTAGIANAGTGVIDFNNSTVQNVLGNGIDSSAGELNVTNSTVAASGANGILATGTGTSQLTVTQSTITNSGASGIAVGQNANVTIAGSSLTANTLAGIETLASGTGTVVASNTRIDGTLAAGRATNGVLMNGLASVNLQNSSITNTITGVTISGAGQLTMGGGAGSSIANITANGLEISASPTAPGVAGSANLANVSMQTIGGDGIRTTGGAADTNGGGSVSFVNSRMTGIGGTGIVSNEVGNKKPAPQGTGAVIFVENSSISDAANGGIQVENSNLNVQGSEITNAGPVGIESIDRSTALISDTTISGDTTTGILASARNDLSWNGAPTGDFNYLTATNNTISTVTNGILVQGAIATTGGTPNAINSQGIVRANISLNSIDATNAIGLTTVGGVVGTVPAAPGVPLPPAVTGGLITGNGRPQGIQVAAQSRLNLEALNGGAAVTETPAPPAPESVTTSVDYVPGLFVQQPPSP